MINVIDVNGKSWAAPDQIGESRPAPVLRDLRTLPVAPAWALRAFGKRINGLDKATWWQPPTATSGGNAFPNIRPGTWASGDAQQGAVQRVVNILAYLGINAKFCKFNASFDQGGGNWLKDSAGKIVAFKLLEVGGCEQRDFWRSDGYAGKYGEHCDFIHATGSADPNNRTNVWLHESVVGNVGGTVASCLIDGGYFDVFLIDNCAGPSNGRNIEINAKVVGNTLIVRNSMGLAGIANGGKWQKIIVIGSPGLTVTNSNQGVTGSGEVLYDPPGFVVPTFDAKGNAVWGAQAPVLAEQRDLVIGGKRYRIVDVP